MQLLMILVLFASVLALCFAAFNFFGVKKLPEGDGQMREIASAIRTGAAAFISYEYKILFLVIAIVATVIGIVTMWQAGAALAIGAAMSSLAGLIGMKIATYANVRVSERARSTKDIGATVKAAFRGGSVMGLCVGGFALLGLFFVYLIFGLGMGQLHVTEASYVNFLGLRFIPFTMTLSGCSTVSVAASTPRRRTWAPILSGKRRRILRRTTRVIRRRSRTMLAIMSGMSQGLAPTCSRAMSGRSAQASSWPTTCFCSLRRLAPA